MIELYAIGIISFLIISIMIACFIAAYHDQKNMRV